MSSGESAVADCGVAAECSWVVGVVDCLDYVLVAVAVSDCYLAAVGDEVSAEDGEFWRTAW